MRILRFLLPVGVLAFGVLVYFAFDWTREVVAPTVPVERAAVVSVQVVSKRVASPTLRVFGTVESPHAGTLAASLAADVVAVNVLEGDAVARGRAVVELDDADVALTISQREAELTEIAAMLSADEIKRAADREMLAAEAELLALAKRAVARAERLAQSQTGTQAALDQARRDEQRQLLAVAARRQAVDEYEARRAQLQARHERAAALLQRAELDRERSRIRAPFDARITEVLVSPGDRTGVGTPLVRWYDEARLEVRAQVPSAYLPALRGAENAVHAEVIGGENIALTLHRLSASVGDGQSGVDAFFRVRDGSAAKLPVPGGTLEIIIKLPPIADVIVLAPQALYGRDRVYEVRGGVLQARTVRRLGQQSDATGRQMLLIAGDGFNDGDQILNSILPQAVSGLKVEVAAP